VRKQHPFANLRYRYPCLRFTYPEAMKLLRAEGPALLQAMQRATDDPAERERLAERARSVAAHGDLEDIGTEDEKLLGEVVANMYGQDFYIIDKFPADVRPFYTMPDPQNPKLSNSYDIFIRGEEVTSGAQRIHDPQMLLERQRQRTRLSICRLSWRTWTRSSMGLSRTPAAASASSAS